MIFIFYFLFFTIYSFRQGLAFLFSFKSPPHFIRLYSPPLMTLTLSEAASSKKWILLRHSFLADPKYIM